MSKTIVAVIDAGGRGSALIDKYAKSPKVDELIAIPGNDLMDVNTSKPVSTYPELKTTSKEEILKICQEKNVSFVDVAQDNAIEAGVSDLLRENGFKVFGASKDAGRLEWDKAYSREFMIKYELPIPKFWVFNDPNKAKEFLKSQTEQPFVIKASGLAEGKGVIIAQSIAQSVSAVDEMSRFGTSGETFLIEEFLEGEEFSAFALSDVKSFQTLGNAQDHKKVFDGDKGANTGGMGCSTPALVVNQDIQTQVDEIFKKTFEGLKKEGLEYQGVLYLGGIVVNKKVYIIEYNSRWGDPEVESILPGIKNDWYEVGTAVAKGNLDQVKVESDGLSRIVVTAASLGYPDDYSKVKGQEILGLKELIKNPEIKVYGAGVKKSDEKYLANGGRLFYVVASGKNVLEARAKAYQALENTRIEGENDEICCILGGILGIGTQTD